MGRCGLREEVLLDEEAAGEALDAVGLETLGGQNGKGLERSKYASTTGDPH